MKSNKALKIISAVAIVVFFGIIFSTPVQLLELGQTSDYFQAQASVTNTIPWSLHVLILDGINRAEKVDAPLNKAIEFVEKNSRFRFTRTTTESRVSHTYTRYNCSEGIQKCVVVNFSDLDSKVLNALPTVDSYILFWNTGGNSPLQAGSTWEVANGIPKNSISRPYATIPTDPWWFNNNSWQGFHTRAASIIAHELVNIINSKLESTPYNCATLAGTTGDPADKYESDRLKQITDACYAKFQTTLVEVGEPKYYLYRGGPTQSVVTSVLCGDKYTFDVSGYSGQTIWLEQNKDNKKIFDGPFPVPMSPYTSACNKDEGLYITNVYTNESASMRKFIGSTNFEIKSAALKDESQTFKIKAPADDNATFVFSRDGESMIAGKDSWEYKLENAKRGDKLTVKAWKDGVPVNDGHFLKICQVYKGNSCSQKATPGKRDVGSWKAIVYINGVEKGTVTVKVQLPLKTVGSQIKVISPNGGEIWGRGKAYTIKWKSSGDISSVDVLVQPQTGTQYNYASTYIGQGIANKESLSWKIPTDFPIGSYKIRIGTPTGTSAMSADESDASFSVVGDSISPQAISFTYSHNNETMVSGQDRWTISVSGLKPGDIVYADTWKNGKSQGTLRICEVPDIVSSRNSCTASGRPTDRDIGVWEESLFVKREIGDTTEVINIGGRGVIKVEVVGKPETVSQSRLLCEVIHHSSSPNARITLLNGLPGYNYNWVTPPGCNVTEREVNDGSGGGGHWVNVNCEDHDSHYFSVIEAATGRSGQCIFNAGS